MGDFSRNKRGQVTIFVILGLIILIGAGIFFYLQSKATVQQINLPKLTGDAGQVQSYVEGCIDQVGRQGLSELGRHGGYIDPVNDTYMPIQISYNTMKQTESDLAFLNQNDKDSGIAYWYYSKSNNGCWHCDVSSLTPPVPLMELQLGKYMDINLKSCLNDFRSFRDQGFDITELTNISTAATVSESTVNFFVNYSVRITKNNNAQDNEIKTIDAFDTEVDVPLLKYYKIAANITQNEIDNEYLDSFALVLLGQYDRLDASMLPPLSAYRFGYDPIFWSKTNVRGMYESLLTSYVPFFRIKGTANDINGTLTQRPFEENIYRQMRLPLFTEDDIYSLDLKDIEINHIYVSQPIYLDVRPSNGDLVSPFVSKDNSALSKALSNVQPDQDYEFFYDISYPVIVEIKDDRPGKEFTFMFALQGNIKENKLLSDWLVGLGTIPWSHDNVKIYDNTPAGTTTFDPETGEEAPYEPITATTKFFCDKLQRTSGEVKLRTYDSVTEQPLNGVAVSYYCGTYASCYMDTTRYDAVLDEAAFKGQLPLCMNGYIELEKEGYLRKTLPLTTAYAKSDNLGSTYMEPIVTKNISVKKYLATRLLHDNTVMGYSIDTPVDIGENDSIILTMDKITYDQFDEPWSQTLVFGRGGSENNTIQLVSGVYTVSAQLLDYNGVVIPKQCKEICIGTIIKCSKTQKIPDSDINISVAMQGGIELNESNPFTITVGNLVADNNLVINIVRMPDPRCLDDMNEPAMTGYMARKYRSELMPKFVVPVVEN